MGAKLTVASHVRGSLFGIAAAALMTTAALAAPPDTAKPATTQTKAATTTPPSAAATTAPRKLASGKLGDFESGEMKNEKDHVGWDTFTFAQGAKKPEATAKVVDGGAPNTGKKVLHFEGTIPDDAQIGFMGLGCGFGGTEADPQRADVSAFKGIRFRVRGDENAYRLVMLTDAVTDYNYHGLNFVAEKAWTAVDIPFAKLEQVQGWGTPVPFDPKHVKAVSISTLFQATGPAWFEVDNVEFYK